MMEDAAPVGGAKAGQRFPSSLFVPRLHARSRPNRSIPRPCFALCWQKGLLFFLLGRAFAPAPSLRRRNRTQLKHLPRAV